MRHPRIIIGTAPEFLAHAGLDPRYVREWPGAMVTGGLVKYLPDTDEYLLPGSHAALLTRSAAPDNFNVTWEASMRRIAPAKLLAILVLLSLTTQPGATAGSDLRDLDRRIDPVEVSGDILSAMTGAATEHIRVYASRNKTLLPIPFQLCWKI